MFAALIPLLRAAWPFVLALAIWGWQEARLVTVRIELSRANKAVAVQTARADAAASALNLARAQASQAAQFYATQQQAAEAAAKEQQRENAATIASLNARVGLLSRERSIHLSGPLVGLFDLTAATANAAGPAATTAAEPRAGAAAVPEPAAPAAVDISERQLGALHVAAGAAYQD